MPLEDDDPVISSYNVYISPHQSTSTSKPPPKFYILQYPSHRPHTKPYTSSRSQKPTSLRIKPTTGIFEVDIPLLTSEHYNRDKGSEYGKAVHDAKAANPHISHGMSGGFAQNQSSNQPVVLSDVPQHNGVVPELRTQVLGGKVSTPSDRDPVYMLATMNSNSKEIHLTHLDAVVQMRPQLHHIDAADDQKRRADIAEKAGKTKSSAEVGTVKLETRAIEMKLKDASKEDPKDRNLNVNARLLREIQNDVWVKHDWVERHDDDYLPPLVVTGGEGVDGTEQARKLKLKSALDNDEWLNRMSSPGIELRTRLKGRDRERARRKRQERLRAAKAEAGANAGEKSVGPFAEVSASESDSEDDVDDDPNTVEEGAADEEVEEVQEPPSPKIQIKQESATAVEDSAPAPASPVKRRGRPKKV